MTTTTTYTATYTRVDIAKVFEFFRAELRLAARTTGSWTDDYAAQTADDIIAHAIEGYVDEVHVVLHSAGGAIMRVARYVASGDAGDRTGQNRPGGNLWPETPGGRLEIVLVMSDAWRRLSVEAQRKFYANLKGSWGPSSFDLSYPGMTASAPRDYVSNAYGLRRTTLSRGA